MKSFTMKLGFSLFLLCNFSNVLADVGRGIKALENNDYQSALIEFENSAKNNDPRAYAGLAYMYRSAKGVPMDKEKAFEYQKKGYELGDIESTVAMGQSYYFGKDYVKQDYSEAIKYFSKCATLKNNVCQYFVGVMHIEGHGFNKSKENAEVGAKYLEDSFLNGRGNAAIDLMNYNLNMFGEAQGNKKIDYLIEAWKWSKLLLIVLPKNDKDIIKEVSVYEQNMRNELTGKELKTANAIYEDYIKKYKIRNMF